SDFGVRMGLLVASVLSGAGALLVYRKEFSSIPRKLVLGFLLGLIILGSLTAGVWIDRYDGSGPAATMMNTLRGLSSSAFAPVNRLMLCILAIFTGAQVSFEREPGSHRVFLSR